MEERHFLSPQEDLSERRAQKDFAIMMWKNALLVTEDEIERERIEKEIKRLEEVSDRLE